jgi:magnesium-protoporphyrin O-methyltransferase
MRPRPIRPIARSTTAGIEGASLSFPCSPPPPASEYGRVFSHRFARYDARRYRRRGRLPKTARGLAALVGGADGETVLDVGGGVGTLALELLEHGASRATVVELSDGYEDAAAELLAEHRLGDRGVRRLGDFVAEASLVEPHDIVVLHRVVSSYPDADALVSAAATHTRCSLALTYPRERAATRIMIRAVNLALRLHGSSFRTYVHPFSVITAAAKREGLELTRRERHGLIWENAVFERLRAGSARRVEDERSDPNPDES